MNRLRTLRTRFRALFRKRQLDADMDEEMRAHLELRTQANIEAGMNPEEARFAALRQFGWRESIKDECRDQRGVRWLENLLQDIRYGARQLRKNPGFTVVAVLTLALGIGATTAIFSVVNAVLLQPLPFPESHRLVRLSEAGLDWSGGPISFPNFTDWQAQQTVFESLGAFRGGNYNLTGDGEPLRLVASQVSPDVFAALRVQPLLGRVFTAEEDQPNGPLVAVLSDGLWRSRFGGDPDIIGQTLLLSGKSFTVLGVMPAEFTFPGEATLWTPVQTGLADSDRQGRGERSLSAIARLKPGITFEQARAEMDTLGTRLAREYPDANKNRHIEMVSLLDSQVGPVRRALWTLLGAVALVLLIACANVANLLLARAAARQREMAVRAALGAGRWRLVRQLLCESILLASIGGATGLLFAQGGLRLIVALAQGGLPRAAEIGLDARVLLLSGTLALLSGILFGLLPAWQASRPDLQGTLKEAARGTTGGRVGLRHGLVVAQVAVTLVLLVGAGLLLRSFHQLHRVNPGFAQERVLTFRFNLSGQKYPHADAREGFFRSLLERLRALPGVQAASIASQVPLDELNWDTSFLIEGRPEPPPSERPALQVHLVAPDYFQVLGIPLLRGRAFTEQDNREHTRGTAREPSGNAWLNVIIIDEEFARRHFPNEDPIGQQIRIPWGPKERNPLMTIVGVVGRVREEGLRRSGGMVQAYFSLFQRPDGYGTVSLKSAVAPETLIAAARQQVLALDPELPIYNVRTLAAMRSDNIAPERLNFTLLGIFAVVALTLAVIGLYGVLAYAVAQRQREIGVRLALGAQRRNVLGLIVGEGMRLTLLGVGIGLAAALAFSRVLRSLLFEVQPTDPLTFAAVPLLLAAVALFACWLPARRAAWVDPMTVLRAE